MLASKFLLVLALCGILMTANGVKGGLLEKIRGKGGPLEKLGGKGGLLEKLGEKGELLEKLLEEKLKMVQETICADSEVVDCETKVKTCFGIMHPFMKLAKGDGPVDTTLLAERDTALAGLADEIAVCKTETEPKEFRICVIKGCVDSRE